MTTPSTPTPATTPRKPNRTAKATARNAAPKPVKAAPKPAPKPAPAVKKVPAPRKAKSPAERAKMPLTANMVTYVEWLNREAFDGKMSEAQKKSAGIAITLYGRYQISPERRAARGA